MTRPFETARTPAIFGTVEIKLPESLWRALDASARREGKTVDEAVAFLVDALPMLSRQDISELKEPPKEKLNRICTLDIGSSRKISVERLGSENACSYSALIRRALHAFLITRDIAIINCQLQLTQMHFNFADNYERDKSDFSASRQHWEAL
jgi:hypothetical protein